MPALGRLVEHDPRSRGYQATAAPVKRSVLWGHHAPVLDQGQLGSCHDPETEVLTRNGWLPFPDLTNENELATVDRATGELTYERPVRVVAKTYSGDMHYLESRGHNFAVTADHMMLVRKWDERRRVLADDYSFVPMAKVGWYAGLMTSVHQNGGSATYTLPGIPGYKRASQRLDLVVDMGDWLRFLGIYLAEGTMLGVAGGKQPNKIQIAAVKDREKTFIRALLTRLGVRALELKDRFTFENARIYRELENLGLKGIYAADKFVPRFAFEQSSDLIECLLQGHREGDGSYKNGTWTHHTSSAQLADDLQELAFLAGYKTGVSTRQPRTSTMRDGRVVKGRHIEHCVRALKGSKSSIERRMLRVEHYDGMVYCAEVPTHHTLVTRRHGKVLISGNCTGNATAQLINTDFFAAVRPHGYLTEDDAVRIYSLATRLDGIPSNTYPPTDGGSSGIGAAKAGVKLGYFHSYSHAFGFDHFAAALQLQPLIVGTVWTEGMFNPSSIGYIRPTGAEAGGHEYLALGISWETKTLTFLNSWGSGWGDGGRFHVHFSDFQSLLAQQGDATAPTLKAAG